MLAVGREVPHPRFPPGDFCEQFHLEKVREVEPCLRASVF